MINQVATCLFQHDLRGAQHPFEHCELVGAEIGERAFDRLAQLRRCFERLGAAFGGDLQPIAVSPNRASICAQVTTAGLAAKACGS